MRLSILSYLKEKYSNFVSKKKVVKSEPKRQLRVRSNGKVDFIAQKIKTKRLWTNHNNKIKGRKIRVKYRRKRKKYGIRRYKRRKALKQRIQKHKPLPIEEPKAVRKKKKRFVLPKTYIRLRRFKQVYNVFFYQAPFFRSLEIYLYKIYKRIVLDEAKRKRKIFSRLSNKLSTKDIDRLTEVHLSNSSSNVFVTVREGYIQQRKRKPLIFDSRGRQRNTLLRRGSRKKKGYSKFKIKTCKTNVVLKLSPPLLNYTGSKKLTNYAREQTLFAAGKFLKTRSSIFLRIVSNHSRIRAFRRRKIFRPILKEYTGFTLSYRNNFRRAHGFLRKRKLKRL